MRQVSHPLPAGMPICQPGHHPQLVQTFGAPNGHRIGTPCPPQWHTECHQCGIGTIPTDRAAVALLRWRATPDLFHTDLSQMPHVRLRVIQAMAAAN